MSREHLASPTRFFSAVAAARRVPPGGGGIQATISIVIVVILARVSGGARRAVTRLFSSLSRGRRGHGDRSRRLRLCPSPCFKACFRVLSEHQCAFSVASSHGGQKKIGEDLPDSRAAARTGCNTSRTWPTGGRSPRRT